MSPLVAVVRRIGVVNYVLGSLAGAAVVYGFVWGAALLGAALGLN